MTIPKSTAFLLLSMIVLGGACKRKLNESQLKSDSDTTAIIYADTLAPSLSKIDLPNPLLTTEDSIREHFGINDSIQLLEARYYRSPNPEHSRAFIDFNKHSIFHDRILSIYGCDCIDEEIYNNQYYDDLKTYRDSISGDIHQYNHLFGHWIPIYRHQGNFYLNFITCEFNRHGFTLSDSTFVEYPMDGPTPKVLLKIREIKNGIYITTTNGRKSFTTVLKKLNGSAGIYTLDEGNRRLYLIHEKYIHHYFVIAEDCHEVGASFEYAQSEKID